MSSMSPPAGSPEPVKKRGRGRGRGAGLGDSGSGRGGGSGRGRKRKQAAVQDERAPSMSREGSASVAGTPLPAAGLTPGASGIAALAGFSPAAATPFTREGSPFSSSRRSATVKGVQEEGEQEDDEDEDDDADDGLDLLLGDEDYDEQAKERAEAKEALRLLLDQFTPEQLDRYEVYRRSGFQKNSVRRLVNHVLAQSCSPNIVVAVRGLAKVFVGEIVEEARRVQAEGGHEGPVAPDDLREAYRRYKEVQDKRGSERAKLFVR